MHCTPALAMFQSTGSGCASASLGVVPNPRIPDHSVKETPHLRYIAANLKPIRTCWVQQSACNRWPHRHLLRMTARCWSRQVGVGVAETLAARERVTLSQASPVGLLDWLAAVGGAEASPPFPCTQHPLRLPALRCPPSAAFGPAEFQQRWADAVSACGLRVRQVRSGLLGLQLTQQAARASSHAPCSNSSLPATHHQ